MATLILRPVSDVSSSHTKSSGSSAYSLIDETSQDGDSTYIYQAVTSTSQTSKTTICKLGGTAPSYNWYLQSVTVTAYAKCTVTGGNSAQNLKIAYRTSESGSNTALVDKDLDKSSYTKYSTGTSSVAHAYYKPNQLPDFWVYLETYGKKGSSKSQNKNLCITQAYMTVTYVKAYVCEAVAVGGCTASVDGTMSAGAARTWTATLQDGYNFVGWLDETNYQAYQNGNSYSVLTTDLTYTSGTISQDMTLYAVAVLPQPTATSRLFINVNGTWRKVVCVYQKSETEWVSVASDGTHINKIGQEVLEQFGNGGYIVIPKSDE